MRTPHSRGQRSSKTSHWTRSSSRWHCRSPISFSGQSRSPSAGAMSRHQVHHCPSPRCSVANQGSGTHLFSNSARPPVTMAGISGTRLAVYWQVCVGKPWTSSERRLLRFRGIIKHWRMSWSRDLASWSIPQRRVGSWHMCGRIKVISSKTAYLPRSPRHIQASTTRWNKTWQRNLLYGDVRTVAQPMTLLKRTRKLYRMPSKRSKIPLWTWRHSNMGVQWHSRSVLPVMKMMERMTWGVMRRRSFETFSTNACSSTTVIVVVHQEVDHQHCNVTNAKARDTWRVNASRE